MNDRCSSVTTIPQFTGTCWFNALLMALLYSDKTRVFFQNNLRKLRTTSKTRRKIISMFSHILTRHYYRVHQSTMDVFSTTLKPERILKQLHNANKQLFYFNPNTIEGHHVNLYLIQLMKYFKMNDRVLYCKSTKSSLRNLYVTLDNYERYITMNNQFNAGYRTIYKNTGLYKRALREIVRNINYDNIDVLFVQMSDRQNRNINNIDCLPDGLILSGKISETISLGGHTYVVDSLMLSSLRVINGNNNVPGHSIAGVTCNGKRYLYNGWIRDTQNNAMTSTQQRRNADPCMLMKFDWFNNKYDFCLNTRNCNLTPVNKTKLSKMLRRVVCFNVRDSHRIYVYVKTKKNVSIR